MTARILPSAERVRELLHYDPLTGIFTWLFITSNRVKVGDVAGSPDGRGYIGIRIDNRRHSAHRLAWLYVYSAWPVNEIDHRNNIKNDNRLSNLRDCSRSENLQNQSKPQSNNKSGFRGVFWHGRDKAWRAVIKVNRKQIYLGLHPTAELAYAAYLEAKRRMHPACTI